METPPVIVAAVIGSLLLLWILRVVYRNFMYNLYTTLAVIKAKYYTPAGLFTSDTYSMTIVIDKIFYEIEVSEEIFHSPCFEIGDKIEVNVYKHKLNKDLTVEANL